MASKTTADKPKTTRGKKAAPAAEPAANGNAVKAQNIASASFVVPEEAFTVELPDDPGPARKRHTFAKIPDVLNLPDLIELQKASFKWFISDGLKDAFDSISPIKDFTGNLVLEFGEHSLGEPKYSVEECRERDMTYSAPLRVRVRLITAESGEIKGIPDQEIFMGDFPLMTDKGTFMINGAERVIVSQLVRSPGVYFCRTPTPTTGRRSTRRSSPTAAPGSSSRPTTGRRTTRPRARSAFASTRIARSTRRPSSARSRGPTWATTGRATRRSSRSSTARP